MKNREEKKKLIEKGICEEYSQQRFNMRKNKQFEECENYLSYCHSDGTVYTEEEFNNLKQIFKARKEQRKKIRKWITYYLNRKLKGEPINIYFATFTYSNDKGNLSATSLKNKILRRLNNDNVVDYVINVDYGTKNDRLHYHGLIIIKDSEENYFINVKRKTKDNKYIAGKKLITPYLLNYEKNVGFFDMEPLKDNEKSINKLSNYINKLVLHSLKVKQSYISTKKGTKYQKIKKAYKVLEKSINERTIEENELINELYEIDNIENNAKSIKDIYKYLKVENNIIHGTINELNWLLEQQEKNPKFKTKKEEIFNNNEILKDIEIFKKKEKMS